MTIKTDKPVKISHYRGTRTYKYLGRRITIERSSYRVDHGRRRSTQCVWIDGQITSFVTLAQAAAAIGPALPEPAEKPCAQCGEDWNACQCPF